MADDIVSRLEMIRGTQFTPTEDALVVEAAETITRLRSALQEREEALTQANVDILTVLGACRDDMPEEAVAIFQRIAKDCASLNKDQEG